MWQDCVGDEWRRLLVLLQPLKLLFDLCLLPLQLALPLLRIGFLPCFISSQFLPLLLCLSPKLCRLLLGRPARRLALGLRLGRRRLGLLRCRLLLRQRPPLRFQLSLSALNLGLAHCCFKPRAPQRPLLFQFLLLPHPPPLRFLPLSLALLAYRLAIHGRQLLPRLVRRGRCCLRFQPCLLALRRRVEEGTA